MFLFSLLLDYVKAISFCHSQIKWYGGSSLLKSLAYERANEPAFLYKGLHDCCGHMPPPLTPPRDHTYIRKKRTTNCWERHSVSYRLAKRRWATESVCWTHNFMFMSAEEKNLLKMSLTCHCYCFFTGNKVSHRYFIALPR